RGTDRRAEEEHVHLDGDRGLAGDLARRSEVIRKAKIEFNRRADEPQNIKRSARAQVAGELRCIGCKIKLQVHASHDVHVTAGHDYVNRDVCSDFNRGFKHLNAVRPEINAEESPATQKGYSDQERMLALAEVEAEAKRRRRQKRQGEMRTETDVLNAEHAHPDRGNGQSVSHRHS